MPSVSTTIKLTFLFCLVGLVSAKAQQNSPYSRYGIGDIYPYQNILNRGMGGVTAAYIDPVGQTVNFSNPASYSSFRRNKNVGGRVVYDLGFSVDARTLRSKTPTKKFSSAGFIPSYLSLGVPLAKNLGMALGLRPYSQVNYSITQRTRLAGIDSAEYLYEGNGGLNQAFIGLGKRWGGLSIGFNTGYLFGKRETSTRLAIINTDTNYSPFYYKSNHTTTTYLGRAFFSAGAIYEVILNSKSESGKPREDYGLMFGATAMLKQDFNATQDLTRETFEYDAAGGAVSLDSVYKTTGSRLNIQVPATYNFGLTYNKKVISQPGTDDEFSYMAWMIGAEFETSKWSQYRFNGAPDRVGDYWQFRMGGQWQPEKATTKLFGKSTYRAGFSFGKDYINADNKGLKTYSATFGMGVPILVRGSIYARQFTVLNFAVEYGKRGSKVNNITENYFRFSLGVSLSDLWFHKRRYD
jgi:hypothetical protein